MITNYDIVKSINKVIYDNFNCEIINDEQAKDVECPTFFVTVHELSSVSRLGYTQDLVQAYITYVDKKTMTLEERLNIKQKMKSKFDLDLDIINEDKNVLIIDDRKFQDVENTIVMTLTFNFLNGKEEEKDYDNRGSANVEELHYKDNKQKIIIKE